MVALKMSNLKKQVINFKTKCFGAVADPRSVGVHLLAKVIPSMDGTDEMAFVWHWSGNDICVYTQAEYNSETRSYRNTHKMKKEDGDTIWFYEFKNREGKMRKALMTTEIWYKEGADHATSPIAMLMGQLLAAGLHIVKVKFEDVA